MAGRMMETAIEQGLAVCSEETPDEDLLAQFLEGKGVASEDAFRTLVERHGPRILGICRHILDRIHDAEDAFQATFLALARNGASIRDRGALGGWLQEVAYRTALKTRARRNRRQTIEKQVMAMPLPRDVPDDQGERASLAELQPVLHEEVVGLPDKYRIPVVLSYLEGKTNEEVAELLKWPVGTVKGRLSRGRALLRSRLTRRGIALSAATLLMSLSRSRASAVDVSADLVARTLGLSIGSGSGVASADGLSAEDAGESVDPDFWSRLLKNARPGDRPEDRNPLPPSDAAPAIGLAAGLNLGESATASPALPASTPASLPNPRQSPSFSRGRRLLTVSILLVAFPASLYIGAALASVSYGGTVPSIRSMLSGLSGLVPSLKTKPGADPCHPGGDR